MFFPSYSHRSSIHLGRVPGSSCRLRAYSMPWEWQRYLTTPSNALSTKIARFLQFGSAQENPTLSCIVFTQVIDSPRVCILRKDSGRHFSPEGQDQSARSSSGANSNVNVARPSCRPPKDTRHPGSEQDSGVPSSYWRCHSTLMRRGRSRRNKSMRSYRFEFTRAERRQAGLGGLNTGAVDGFQQPRRLQTAGRDSPAST